MTRDDVYTSGARVRHAHTSGLSIGDSHDNEVSPTKDSGDLILRREGSGIPEARAANGRKDDA
jgi:hypothetical protein